MTLDILAAERGMLDPSLPTRCVSQSLRTSRKRVARKVALLRDVSPRNTSALYLGDKTCKNVSNGT
jgi:hypothetical protein